jgi:hypothetical protein
VDLVGVEHEEAAPPFFERQVALLFRVQVGIDIVLLGPEGVGRIEEFKVRHEVRAVENALPRSLRKELAHTPPISPPGSAWIDAPPRRSSRTRGLR